MPDYEQIIPRILTGAGTGDRRPSAAPAKARVVGAYLSQPLEQVKRPAYAHAVLQLPGVTGLEIPLCTTMARDDAKWLMDVLPPGARNIATLMGACDEAAADDPAFGLASTDPAGRNRALDLLQQARHSIARMTERGQHVLALEVHSSPTHRDNIDGTSQAFAASLAQAADWDWGETALVVEHCDAARSSGGASKGFLTLDEEIDAVETVRALSPRTPVMMSINWGRSAIDTRNAGGPLTQIDRLRRHGLLAGVILSGASDRASSYGAPWTDAQLPAAAPDGSGEASSLLTPQRAVEAMERAGDHLLFDGVTFAVMPQWTPSQERLRYVRGLLSVMPRGHLSVAF
ncbi:Putative chemotaxis protein, resembles CheA [Propionibacterium freudenreichii]|uniref:DUF4862 family protein n=1 Tax=Propionibacterium freudenreichii TaxID=1744 RepID=UPI000BC2D461|nr:DUF4862 family protein [Propionibacterium freudenreichii]MDK9331071.1 DUF4862 family protein [Propionibacterium freudenreichii]MDK9351560.1 DUF4862 family protein [Propionibacterium freudenreichii]SBN60883.1 Putative chemotaxis protein, resembles CheA [Propionibacterium freudenreichii]SBN96422.1 Putative chemotaxis protein, resembles CheA [Propionibacterium freudenreichii]SBT30085.1 Putative chemotaxis protein, resembles CheA [Propionibacterium freudenreichii]